MTFILPSNSQLHCITGASRCPRQNLGPGKVTPNWGSSNFCKLKTSKVALYQTVPMMVYVDRSGCVVGVQRKLGQHTFSVADSFHCLPLLQDELWRDAYPEGPSGASQCWLMWHRLVLCGCLGCWPKNRYRELEYTHKKCLTLCYSQTCRYIWRVMLRQNIYSCVQLRFYFTANSLLESIWCLFTSLPMVTARPPIPRHVNMMACNNG